MIEIKTQIEEDFDYNKPTKEENWYVARKISDLIVQITGTDRIDELVERTEEKDQAH